LVLFDPLLVPTGSAECPGGKGRHCVEQAVLLLPGPEFAGVVDRARDARGRPAAAAGRAWLVVRAERPGTLAIHGQTLDLGPRPRSALLPSGRAQFHLRAGGRHLLGVLELPDRGEAIVSFDSARRRMVVVYRPLP
jgi:hypothetical protein